MGAKLLGWVRKGRVGLILGVVVWVVLAIPAVLSARQQGRQPLEALVTWDEWAAAFMLLPWLFRGLLSAGKMFTRNARRSQALTMVAFGIRKEDADRAFDTAGTEDGEVRTAPWISMVTVAAWVVFALDLVVRAVFGLGWQPFV